MVTTNEILTPESNLELKHMEEGNKELSERHQEGKELRKEGGKEEDPEILLTKLFEKAAQEMQPSGRGRVRHAVR